MTTSSLHQTRRLYGSTTTIVCLLVVIMAAMVVPPAVSTTEDEKSDAEVIKVAASCATRCRDLCGVLPESEDPGCAGRCDSISAAFNGSVKDPNALGAKTAFSAVREMQMCFTGCSLRCPAADAGCKAKCAETFRLFGPAMVALGKTMAASGLAPPEDAAAAAAAPGDLKFQASCSDACSRKCAATASQGKAKESCGGICAEACGFYGGVTTVLRAAMPPAAVPSPAALGENSVANTFKACIGHCAAKDGKCANKCSYAAYILTKAKASMKLATGAFGLPA